MKNNKTYKTLAGAYTAAEKAGAVRFTNEAYYTQVCICITNTINGGKDANKVALWNLVKYENTLCALECTKEKTFKWTAIGHFDSDGLLYPMNTEAQTENKPTPKKPRPRKPTPAKGNGIDFGAFKGTVKECNKALHAELVSRGLKDSKTKEYQDIWNSRPWAQK